MGPILRLEFYHYLNACLDVELYSHLEILILLTKEARDVKGFENEIGDLLYTWMTIISKMDPNLSNPNKLECFRVILPFLVSLFKFSFLYFSQSQVSCLLESVGHVLKTESNMSIKEQCLLIYDTTVKYGQVGLESLDLLLTNLCILHQVDEFKEFIFSIAYNILSSHRGRGSVKTLVGFLKKQDEEWVVGSCLFLSMYHWGDYSIPTLYTSSHYLLDNFLSLISCPNSPQRVQMAALKAVKSFFEFQKSKELTVSILEMDMTVQMVKHCIPIWEFECPKEFILSWKNSQSLEQGVLQSSEQKEEQIVAQKKVEKDENISILSYFILQIKESYSNLLPDSQSCFISILHSIVGWLDDDGVSFLCSSGLEISNSLLNLTLKHFKRSNLIHLVLNHIKWDDLNPTDCFLLLELMDLIDSEDILKEILSFCESLVQHSCCCLEFGHSLVDKLIAFKKQSSFKSSVAVKTMIHLFGVFCKDSECNSLAIRLYSELVSDLNQTGIPISIKMDIIHFLGGFSILKGVLQYKDPFTNSIYSCFYIPLTIYVKEMQSAYLKQIIVFLSFETHWDVYLELLNSLESQFSLLDLNESFIGKESNTLEAKEPFIDLTLCLVELLKSETVGNQLKEIPSSCKLSDLYPYMYRLLSCLLESFKDSFTKKQLDDAVNCFIIGLSRPSITKTCLYSLLSSMFEYESSMIKFLPSLLIKLSQMTFMSLGIPNLEFLSHLARQPLLHTNLTESDYKRVFGIAIQYIRGGGGTENPSNAYITYLAYHVLTMWFVSLPMVERRNYVLFISKQLTTSYGLDLNGELVLDMLALHTFSDCEPRASFTNALGKTWLIGNCLTSIQKVPEFNGWTQVIIRRPAGTVVFWNRLENSDYGPLELMAPLNFIGLKKSSSASNWERKSHARSVSSGSFVIPPTFNESKESLNLIPSLTLSTNASLNPSTNTNQSKPIDFPKETQKRQRSATISHPLDASPSSSSFDPSFLSPLSLPKSKEIPSADPSFVLCQMGCFPNPYLTDSSSLPLLLPNDESISRALSVLDKTPVVDLHKIGVLFVGKGQETESEILSHSCGSKSYNEFLKSLGFYFRLDKSKNIYSGGLDTSSECVDGKYALAHVERVCQVVFHVSTLMPTACEGDSYQWTLKKRHIGNDFVNIIWNESGCEYSLNTLQGQFNYVAIVITPLKLNKCKIQVLHKSDLNFYGPFVEPRILSVCDGLGSLIRTLAIHINIYCHIWTNNQFTTSAKERLNQILRIKDRVKRLDLDDFHDFTLYL